MNEKISYNKIIKRKRNITIDTFTILELENYLDTNNETDMLSDELQTWPYKIPKKIRETSSAALMLLYAFSNKIDLFKNLLNTVSNDVVDTMLSVYFAQLNYGCNKSGKIFGLFEQNVMIIMCVAYLHCLTKWDFNYVNSRRWIPDGYVTLYRKCITSIMSLYENLLNFNIDIFQDYNTFFGDDRAIYSFCKSMDKV
jgi:hypothetical protein